MDNTESTYLQSKVAGSVILYNSKESVISNIHTYICQVDKLYVIDNSEKLDRGIVDILQKIPKVEYHANNGNKGVAYALNIAAKLAIDEGYEFLLTMDDDSRCPDNMVASMINFLMRYKKIINIGIIATIHHTNTHLTEYTLVDYTITSGNLLSLRAFGEVGPFDNSLFIDHVDHEYGIRLNMKGYKVVQLHSARIDHNLGNLITKNFFLGNFLYTSHSPIRNYYFFRNGIVLINKYLWYSTKPCMNITWQLFKELLKVILLESNKTERISLITIAAFDAVSKRLGKKEAGNE